LVLTLSGVLKNIMIVFASMLFYHDIVTPIQFFGFSIALGGLAYYQLGGAGALSGWFGKSFSRVREEGGVDVEMGREVEETVGRGSGEEVKSPRIVGVKSS
jgi:hypothetical protein